MKDYIVFTLGANKQLAKDFAKFWNCPLGKVSTIKFADGESLVKIATDVSDKDVIVIESMAKKPNDCLVQLLLLLDSINRSNARSITVIIPYLGYARQERADEAFEPVSSEVVAKIIESGNYDKLMTIDLHHPVIETFYKRGIKNLSTTDVLANYFLSYLKDKGYSGKDVVVVSPDQGSNNRADRFVFAMRGAKKVVLEKFRPDKDQVLHYRLKGDVTNKVCIIIDDIISTGNTIASACRLLKKGGAKAVFVGASHGVFAKGAVEQIKKAGAKIIAVTNTIEQPAIDGVTCLDILPIIVENL